MTEKRFTIIESQIGKLIHDNHTDMNTGDICIILDLLNELSDENEQLKEGIKLQAIAVADGEITKVNTDEFIQLCKENNELSNENEQLKQQINNIRLDWNQDYRDFNKDTLYIEDRNTKIKLKNGRLYIEVFIPKINEYFRFNYIVVGRKLEKEYNIIKGDFND